jgi:sensor c-di-GMP phosphodiesterase-like protein
MKVSEKYRHIGYSYPGVPKGWQKIVEKTTEDIEKAMWPRWIPLFIKRKIHYLATGNSVVSVKSRFWYKVRKFLTKGQIVTDIKDKYATLRIYGYFSPEIDEIVKKAEDQCFATCERCGSQQKVRTVGKNWVYNLCKSCRYGKKK